MQVRNTLASVLIANAFWMGAAVAQGAPAQSGAQDIRVVEALKKAGAVKCAKAKTELLNFLYKDDEYAYLNQWHQSAPEKHGTLTTIAKTYSDGTVMVTLMGAPTPGGCDVSFTQTFTTAMACTALRETSFKEWVHAGQIGGATLYEEKDATTLSVALSSQPNGCLVVKSGIFFFPEE